MNALLDQLICEVEVVLKGILRTLWVCHIAGVAYGAFHYPTSFLRGINTKLEIVEVVERAAYCQNVAGETDVH